MVKTSLLFVLAFALPTLAAGHAASHLDASDEKAMREYDLTPAKVDKLAKAATRIREYGKTHPDVGETTSGKTIDESVKKLDAYPEVVSMLKSEGLTSREFMVGMMSMMQAGMWTSMSAQYPNAKMPDDINPKNVELLRKHPELMKKWQTAFEEEQGNGKSRKNAAADKDDQDGDDKP
jgi:hypothetical protein